MPRIQSFMHHRGRGTLFGKNTYTMAGSIIQRDPFMITIERETYDQGVVILPPQIMRIAPLSSTDSNNPVSPVQFSEAMIVILAYKDHPYFGTTDIRRNDVFAWEGDRYDVIDFIAAPPGMIQGIGAKREPN